MKIIIITNSSKGLYSFRKELIQELIKKNEVIAITPNNGSIENIRQLGCDIIDTPLDRRGINPINDFKLYREYKKILRNEMPDMVITYTVKPNVYGGIVCRILRIPYVVNITGLGTAFQNEGMLRKIIKLMYKIACKNVKVVFFENEGNRQLFIDEGIVKDSLTCCLNGAGVNLTQYQVSEYPQGDKIKFLFMGRVMAEKGIDELLIAMKRLIADGVTCQLDILGEYEDNYKEKITQYEAEGWLKYWGYQNNVKPFIKKCHCLVLPSWHEGMANTNLECAASGRPIITTNIHGCLEAVEDGVSGYLCDRKNPDDLYRIMKKFVNLSYEEKKAMGLAGRKRMEEIFDKEKVVSKTICNIM